MSAWTKSGHFALLSAGPDKRGQFVGRAFNFYLVLKFWLGLAICRQVSSST